MKRAALTLAMFVWATAAWSQDPPTSGPGQRNPSVAALPDISALVGSARASKLIGSSVYRGDSTVGKIDDILVNLNDGRLSAVILAVGGVLGVGDKRVAVSPQDIKVGSEARFTTDLTKDQLSEAPAFQYENLNK